MSAARKRARQATVSFPRQDSDPGIYDPSIYSWSGARVEPCFSHGLGLDLRLRAFDELLIAVRALREELIVIHCNKTGELTLRMAMMNNHRRGPR